MKRPPLPPRPIYCVPCGEICPHTEPAAVEAWKAAHEKARHMEAGPMTKGAHFAPVPKAWG